MTGPSPNSALQSDSAAVGCACRPPNSAIAAATGSVRIGSPNRQASSQASSMSAAPSPCFLSATNARMRVATSGPAARSAPQTPRPRRPRVVPFTDHQLESRPRTHCHTRQIGRSCSSIIGMLQVEQVGRDIEPALFDVEVRQVALSARVQLADVLWGAGPVSRGSCRAPRRRPPEQADSSRSSQHGRQSGIPCLLGDFAGVDDQGLPSASRSVACTARNACIANAWPSRTSCAASSDPRRARTSPPQRGFRPARGWRCTTRRRRANDVALTAAASPNSSRVRNARRQAEIASPSRSINRTQRRAIRAAPPRFRQPADRPDRGRS